jgi:hypothetical protein
MNIAMENHTQTNEKEKTNRRMPMWFGWSLSSWELIFFWVTSSAAILGGLGLAAAFSSAIIGYKISDVVTRDADVKISESNARAKEAQAKADEARRDTTKLELAIIEFRKSRSDKTAEHLDELANKITAFAGTQFDIGIGPEGFREQWDFLWQIEPVFEKAGWDFVPWSGSGVMSRLAHIGTGPLWPIRLVGLTNVVNVSLEMHQSSEAKLKPAARALADALIAIGINVSVGGNNNRSANDEVLHFLIGEKQ